MNRKYIPTVDKRRQLSPGFLEDALDEVGRKVFLYDPFSCKDTPCIAATYFKYLDWLQYFILQEHLLFHLFHLFIYFFFSLFFFFFGGGRMMLKRL